VAPSNLSGSGRGIDFGLIFFTSSDAPTHGDKYRLVLESTKRADQYNFSSVWIPERHFTKDGYLYPNPAILSAALARETRQIQLRAGSVVIPLHNPILVAEEWAMVDNLSGGRVGIAFASGWHPTDFALKPENYERRNEALQEGIETVRKLWRGETIKVVGGDGKEAEIRTYPPPIQKELPFWVTAAGNPRTFAKAGAMGANLLTHMYNQSIPELAEKIRLYRDARAEHGYDPETGQVSVMMHTFLNKDEATVHTQAKGHFTEYLKSATYLVNAIATSRGMNVDISSLSEQDLKDYLNFVYERLVSEQRVLFGTPEQRVDLITQLSTIGVSEIACQIDFGVDVELVLESMRYVNQLKELANERLRSQPVQKSIYVEDHALANTLHANQANGNGANGHHHVEGNVHQNGATLAGTDHNDHSLGAIRQRCKTEVELEDFYQDLDNRGVQLASSFQGIKRLWQRDGEALGQIRLTSTLVAEAAAYQVHPTMLDACFQVLIAALPQALFQNENELYLPTALQSFQLHQPLGHSVWSHAQITTPTTGSPEHIEGTVHILNEKGELLAEARGLRLQRTLLNTAASSGTPTPTEASERSEMANWLYELQWEPAQLNPVPQVAQGDTWLIFTDKSGAGQELIARLEKQGAHCISVTAGTRYHASSSKHYRIAAQQTAEVQRVVTEVMQNHTLRGVIHLWSLDTTPVVATCVASLEEDQVLGSSNTLSLIQALINNGGAKPPQLWIATRGAQAVGNDHSQLEIAQSPLWGLGKTTAMEHPELWGGLIDLDPATEPHEHALQITASIFNTAHEDQIAFRAGQSYVARMVRSQAQPDQKLHLYKDGSYLITGGLWGLGLEVARTFALQGAGHLILLGRSKLPARESWDQVTADSRTGIQIAGMRDLEQLGAQVHYASLDVADEDQLSGFLKAYAQQGHPPIRGVIHAASVWQDEQGASLVRPLANLTPEGLATVFRPKIIGSWLLSSLLREAPLDFFVSFSSGASLFGSAAQGNYAAAGEFMDILASYQRAHGQPALSIDWGAISEIGFGGTAEGLRVHEYWETRGIQRINPRQVIATLETLTAQNFTRIGVLKLDWNLLEQYYTQITQLPLVRHLVQSKTQDKSGSNKNTSSILQTLQNANHSAWQQLLEHYVSIQVAGVLRLPLERLDMHQPMTSIGLDSLMAIELKNRLEHELDLRIPIVTFLQGPSIVQFTTQLNDQLTETLQAAPPAQTETTATETITTTDDALLNRLVPGEQKPNNGHSLASLASFAALETLVPELDAQQAEALLAQLDQLSDEQVDTLLNQIAQKEDYNR
jgi:phthiocerol/phenolphthiocerol synthesis type-I polyketide synthase D